MAHGSDIFTTPQVERSDFSLLQLRNPARAPTLWDYTVLFKFFKTKITFYCSTKYKKLIAISNIQYLIIAQVAPI